MLAFVGFFGLHWNSMSLNECIYRLNGPHTFTTKINLINWVHYSNVVGVTSLIAGHKSDELELHN